MIKGTIEIDEEDGCLTLGDIVVGWKSIDEIEAFLDERGIEIDSDDFEDEPIWTFECSEEDAALIRLFLS